MATASDHSDVAGHLVHDELPTPGELVADCHLARRNLGLNERPVTTQSPSLLFADYAADQPKREINVSEAAARLAAVYYAD